MAVCTSCLLALLLVSAAAAARATDNYVTLRVSGVINPVKVRLVTRALARARAEHATLLLISLDTPGGLVSSMNEIVGLLTNADMPVVTFVNPRSAQATSAGAFILLAGDVAAMAPGTRTGAAHPVGEGGKALEGPMNDKATNSLTSLIRSLAERRNRPSAAAEAMVRESTSYTAEQAYERKLIELLAPNENSLLNALDGREIAGRKLHTLGLDRIEVTPSSFNAFLDYLADPTLTALLLSIGVLTLMYELTTPGIGAGGAIGAVLLVLGLMGSSLLPVELSAAALLLTGALALVLEVKLPTHGVLGGAGVSALVLGGLLFVDRADYFGGAPELHPAYLAPMLILVAVPLFFLARRAKKAQGGPQLVGLESLVGRIGQARSSFGQVSANQVGFVFVDGARWQALSDGQEIAEGDTVSVIAVTQQPTRLHVRRIT